MASHIAEAAIKPLLFADEPAYQSGLGFRTAYGGQLPGSSALAGGAAIVSLIFYFASALLSRLIRRAMQDHRRNLEVVFARLAGAAVVLLGLLVAFSIVAPSFQAGDLIKVLGIGSVAIGFGFQNILQNFTAGSSCYGLNPFAWETKSN
ncbi:MAG: hypothetical protein WAN18_19610 [Candidatus Sulfotelmatobacter sp.]